MERGSIGRPRAEARGQAKKLYGFPGTCTAIGPIFLQHKQQLFYRCGPVGPLWRAGAATQWERQRPANGSTRGGADHALVPFFGWPPKRLARGCTRKRGTCARCHRPPGSWRAPVAVIPANRAHTLRARPARDGAQALRQSRPCAGVIGSRSGHRPSSHDRLGPSLV